VANKVAYVIKSASVAPLAGRRVLVLVSIDGDVRAHEAVALETVVRTRYERDDRHGDPPGTHAEFLEQGWGCLGDEVVTGPLIVWSRDADGGNDEIVNPLRDRGGVSALRTQPGIAVVPCTWPPDEDAERLEPYKVLAREREKSNVTLYWALGEQDQEGKAAGACRASEGPGPVQDDCRQGDR
jgi:hypothetical protein